MSAFLLGKAQRLGPVPQLWAEMTAPPEEIAPSNTSREDTEYTTSAPQPETTTVLPPARIAPEPAAWSQPMAPPETTVTPHSAATRADISAIDSP